MNDQQKWPILHILVGIPIVLSISAFIGYALAGWTFNREALQWTGTMATVVGMTYTFLVTLVERSYFMVFWAREKTKAIFAEAEARAEARGEAIGEARGEAIGEARGMKKGRSEGEAKGTAKTNRQWRAWYERQQAAFRDGRPFDEPPPEFPERPVDEE